MNCNSCTSFSSNMDLIAFWQDRFREHALFLFLLLDQNRAPELKQEALQQYQRWNQIMNTRYAYIPQTDSMFKLRKLKEAIILVASQGQINLVLPPQDFLDLVKHMLFELNFVLDYVNGKVTPQDEIAFWTRENAQHTELAGKALPPGQLKADTLRTSARLRNQPLDQILPIIHQSNESALQLDELIKSGQVDTVLNPMLLEHEIKEAQVGEDRIRKLQSM